MNGGYYTHPFNGETEGVEYRQDEDGACSVIVAYRDADFRRVLLVVPRKDYEAAKKSAKAVADAVKASLGGRPLPSLWDSYRPRDRQILGNVATTIGEWFAKKGGIRTIDGKSEEVPAGTASDTPNPTR